MSNVLSRTRTLAGPFQYGLVIAMVAVVTLVCSLTMDLVGYRVAALVLLMAVSVLAMLLDIGPVLVAATLSALAWNFFFIPPIHTFHIGNAEDVLMFLLYFLIALVNAVLTLKIRQTERRVRDKEENERALALYHTLFNSLSHELRTPIATILGAVDALQQDASKLSDPQRRELLLEIDRASERLNGQVGDLLSMGRLESGMLLPRRDWCDVSELIANEVRTVEGERSFVQRTDHLPLFKLDAGMLRAVMNNLLRNAVEHTPTGTTVMINATHRDEACVINVSDDGPGIAPGDAARVFGKFQRGPNVAPGGSGLGLSIVKGFVEAQGGTVDLAQREPHGVVFTVRIPAETSFISNLKHE